MSDAPRCHKEDIIGEFSNRFTRLEQKDEFKDILLSELKTAVEKIGTHMERQTEAMQQIVIQGNDIIHLRQEQAKDHGLIERLFSDQRRMMEKFVNHQLEPVADQRKLKTGTTQTIINAIITAVISAITAVITAVSVLKP